MTNNFKYQSDKYDRQSQRFIIPLYVKDSLGNYNFSATGTFVKYNDHAYILFAAHMLENIEIRDVYMLFNDGVFEAVVDNTIGYIIYKDWDLVIVDKFNNFFDGKNYFNLNINSLIGFDKNHFAWIGFPNSQVKLNKVHNTKNAEKIKSESIVEVDNSIYFKSARYLNIVSKIEQKTNEKIVGKYNRKNAQLKYKGKVSQGVYPKGMSGGAMYHFSKGQKLKDNLDDTFRFAGIGLEYKNDNSIIGLSKEKIVELLNKFDDKVNIGIETGLRH